MPVIFACAGLQHKVISRAITPYDNAPTLAAYFGVKSPLAAIGSPLTEVLAE